MCINASNASIAWPHVWKDRQTGKYKYAVVPSGQVIPVWDNGLEPYNSITLIDTDGQSNLVNEFPHDIGEVLFFPFFNNNTDAGDLDNIKPLIDVYCKVFSGFVNDLEDIQEVHI